MADMTAREAIAELEDSIASDEYETNRLKTTDSWDTRADVKIFGYESAIAAKRMAISALSAQIPRVLNLEEVGEWLDKERPILLQLRKVDGYEWHGKGYTIYKAAERFDEYGCTDAYYGETWRCWNGKPTAEQMAATPWGSP
jgi:hypothetical protein